VAAAPSVSIDDAVAIVRAKLGARAESKVIRADSRLDDLGLSSLEVADAFFRLEDLIGKELDPAAAADAETLGDLVAAVNRQVGVESEAR
jgi:acyl carrier protein